MKYEIRLAALFIEQLTTKEKGGGHFCKKGRLAPFLLHFGTWTPTVLSLSALLFALRLLLLSSHHECGQQTPNNLRFSTQPDSKSSKIHLPNPSRALCCIIWQKVEGFSHVSVELGCDSSHQMWAKAWSSPTPLPLSPVTTLRRDRVEIGRGRADSGAKTGRTLTKFTHAW